MVYADASEVRVLHPSELRSLRSLRTLPPFPASSLRDNLSPADASPLPVAAGGHVLRMQHRSLLAGSRKGTWFSSKSPYFDKNKVPMVLGFMQIGGVLGKNGALLHPGLGNSGARSEPLLRARRSAPSVAAGDRIFRQRYFMKKIMQIIAAQL